MSNVDAHYLGIVTRTAAGLERMLKASGSGFILASGCSLADVQIFYYMLSAGPRAKIDGVTAAFPHLHALRDKVASVPGIARYLAGREKTWDQDAFGCVG